MAKKLLLADDSLTIQKVVGIVFANLDYQLLIAENGDAALDLARKEFPDLVIADIGMPGKDGLELCREIKGDAVLGSTPVLLLPGAFENFDEARATAAGADGWLSKPFESQALITKVEELLAAAPERPVAPVSVPVSEPVDDTPEPVAVEDPVRAEESEAEEAADESESDEGVEAGDDIWDAVTFEEEDLQADISEPLITEEPLVAVSEVDATNEEPIQFEDPAPVIEEAAPIIEEAAPVIEEAAPIIEEAAPIIEEAAPIIEEAAPVIEEAAPVIEEAAPVIEEAAAVIEEAASFVEEEPEEDILELGEEDILELDDDAIIEEEPVAVPDPVAAVDFEEEPAAEVVDFTAPEPVDESGPLDGLSPASDFVFAEDEDEVVEAASEPAVASSLLSGAESSPHIAVAEEQLLRLDPSDMEVVIRKVAGPVIEKMAAQLLEQVVWEVVPDLAESMIKDEIRKIKEGAA